jgi:flagellar biosynthetic protein FliQ
MSEAFIISVAKDALMTSLWACLPMLAVALAVGILVSILQVATSIQDPTLASVPKIFAVMAALLFSMTWVIHVLVSFTERIFAAIPTVAG